MALTDMMRYTHDTINRKGMTLVETMVAFGIFSILIVIATSSFLRATRVQKAAIQLMAVNDNMGITIEQMMREMRTGYHFCTRDFVPTGIGAAIQAQCQALDAGEIQFVNAANNTVRYRLFNAMIERGEGLLIWDPANPNPASCLGGELDTQNSGICYRPITANDTKIVSATFQPFHNDVDKYPPRIVMSFQITSNDPLVQTMTSPVMIQTTVSARCGQLSCPSDS